eukprot:gene298-biopygen307
MKLAEKTARLPVTSPAGDPPTLRSSSSPLPPKSRWNSAAAMPNAPSAGSPAEKHSTRAAPSAAAVCHGSTCSSARVVSEVGPSAPAEPSEWFEARTAMGRLRPCVGAPAAHVSCREADIVERNPIPCRDKTGVVDS